MKKAFYSIPFKAESMTKPTYARVDLETSVRQHIKMMLMTIPNQVKFEPAYGGVLNKQHFRLPDKRKGDKKLEEELKDMVLKNIQYLIAAYEPRLKIKNVGVTVLLPKPDKPNPKIKSGRIALEINIDGLLLDHEDFRYTDLIPML
ncbi:MAG: GPW/gp25 family protein [Lewinellaceae bacterium]|nr:GPW/gp25 family protein [Saprospiraceae bacterium]MCB9339187.1 GPW/gp25 family protein [Lewinellaceae bacterium]